MPVAETDAEAVANVMNAKVVSLYLKSLRTTFEEKSLNDLDQEAVKKWKKQWFKEENLFSDLFSRQSSEVEDLEQTNSFNEAAEVSKSNNTSGHVASDNEDVQSPVSANR